MRTALVAGSLFLVLSSLGVAQMRPTRPPNPKPINTVLPASIPLPKAIPVEFTYERDIAAWRALPGVQAVTQPVPPVAFPRLPVGVARKAASMATQLDAEAAVYSRQLMAAMETISTQYVREVSHRRLAAAAVQGLYEAAGKSIPDSLKHFAGDFDKVEKALEGKNLTQELAAARLHLGAIPAIEGDNATRISLQALSRVLDAHSAVLSIQEYQRLSNNRGFQSGVGLFLEERSGDEPLVVRFVLLGGPAQREGIRPGDQVLEIDGQPADKLTAVQAFDRISGDAGAEVTLTLRREGEKEPLKVKLTRTVFKEETVLGVGRAEEGRWRYMLDVTKRIGLIRLTALNSGTSYQLAQALADLENEGVRGLILDLRDCPGGMLSEADSVASVFLEKEIPVALQSRSGKAAPSQGPRVGKFTNVPIVVLVGPDTSGGGELVAAFLQDSNRATVVGQRTRGKASVQNMIGPGTHEGALGVSNYAFRLSTGLFQRPSGKNLHRFPDSKRSDDWGVLPDKGYEVRTSPQLRRQIRYWRLLHDLRPMEDTKALPLDNEENDPVQLLALEKLRKELKDVK